MLPLPTIMALLTYGVSQILEMKNLVQNVDLIGTCKRYTLMVKTNGRFTLFQIERARSNDTSTINCIKFGYGNKKQGNKTESLRSIIVATADSSGYIRMFDVNLIDECVSLRAHTKSIRSLEYGGINDSLMLTCSDDKSAKLWSMPSMNFKCSFVGHHNWVRCAKFGSYASKVATGSDDKTIKLWPLDGNYGACSLTISNIECPISDLSFHPSCDNTLAVTNAAETLIVDLRTGDIVQKYRIGQSTISFYQNNGNYVITSSAEGYKIWDLRETRIMVDSNARDEKAKPILTAFSGFSEHSGPYFASGHDSGSVFLWKTRNLDLLPHNST